MHLGLELGYSRNFPTVRALPEGPSLVTSTETHGRGILLDLPDEQHVMGVRGVSKVSILERFAIPFLMRSTVV
jgi:hypothetical protein